MQVSTPRSASTCVTLSFSFSPDAGCLSLCLVVLCRCALLVSVVQVEGSRGRCRSKSELAVDLGRAAVGPRNLMTTSFNLRVR
ncbi:hypothetical protein PF008_g7477 [Phytophthora fragariae]|uniref:Uncharacterized protein n=1 Tax=Phytophthora fragariae TaxID=53985 RepID=A0A6G0S3Z4_9STRA|nr:hypothetical protein PF008_g7477 [Phytophthora fragariae]